jgi:CHASE3 domain sensor protein
MIRANYIKILFLIIVFVLLAVSVLTYRNLNNYITEVNLIRHSNSIFERSERVLSAIKDAETGHRGYQLTRDTT